MGDIVDNLEKVIAKREIAPAIDVNHLRAAVAEIWQLRHELAEHSRAEVTLWDFVNEATASADRIIRRKAEALCCEVIDSRCPTCKGNKVVTKWGRAIGHDCPDCGKLK